MPPALRLLLFCLINIYTCCTPAHAADWLTVASDRVRRVELDRASITPSEAGTKVAWGRIVLSDEQAKAYGYRTVRALNRYDCRSHSFIIVKRAYLSSEEKLLREDVVETTAPISVKTGTVDDRFFNEVCKPASVTELANMAKRAAENIARTEEKDRENSEKEKSASMTKPMLRRADIQLTKDEPAPAPTTQAPPDIVPRKSPDKPEGKASSPRAEPHRRMAEQPAVKEAATPAAPSSAASNPEHHMSETHPARLAADQLAAERAAEHAAQRAPAFVVRKNPSAIATPRPPSPLTPAAAASAPQQDMRDLHWSYEGADGPENWGKLDPEFSVCSNGKRQSPIDIHDSIKVDQEPIQFDYKPTFFRIVDNGHTIQINYGAGSHITIMGRTYDLIQFHFHHPAEERIDGKGFAMVAHFVHRDPEGRLAIVAVLLEAGKPNSAIQTLWNNLPLEKNEDYTPRVAIQAADLLPPKPDYISYMGSLTTPPCTEGVLWLVMKQPVQLSPEQIDIFTRFYPNNARPVQAASGRIIKESR